MDRTISFRIPDTVRTVLEAEAQSQSIGVTTLLRRITESWAREARFRAIRCDAERVARIPTDQYLDDDPAEWYPAAAQFLAEHPELA